MSSLLPPPWGTGSSAEFTKQPGPIEKAKLVSWDASDTAADHDTVVTQIHAPHEAHALKDEVGIPHDQCALKVLIWNPLGWTGYYFDVVGTIAQPTDSPDAPRFLVIDSLPDFSNAKPVFNNAGEVVGFTGTGVPGNESAIELIAWRRRVASHAHQCWLEARWHPEKGREEFNLRDVKDLSIPAANQFFAEGRKLLQKLSQRGRPRGSTDLSKEEFHQGYVDAYQKLQAQGVRRPSQEKIADQLLVSKRSLERYIQVYGRPSLS